MTYSQTIIDQAHKAILCGSKLFFADICKMLQKKEDGKAKRNKKSIKKSIERRELANTPSQPLWGAGAKYDTQAEYQRACLGSKWK